ncbi:hypothetical protein PIGHUM_00148 [Pigmentiphaga humi]|uniref:Lipoprotein n=1 Tax=Pigmentiphaga humi TaxID=2478468 RepID=A0A3P4AXH6_9BURK|nr:hypothetical protein [Pigmentiphaga humi]VCU68100.1 hypothetical protein PIGHUM_00148 [Pigmentiphaga humi]
MKNSRNIRSWFGKSIIAPMLAAAALLSGCTSFYVDTATKEVPVTAFKRVETPKPVQLVFEFQTKGAPNKAATEYLKTQIAKQVEDSGLFSSVESVARPDLAMLTVTIDNVEVTKDAAAQGFVTGLTFGLAGSAVTDGYICTASYLAPGQSAPVVKTARHALHATIGNASAPAGAVKAASADAAIRQVTQEVLSNVLKELSDDPAFN